MVQALPCWPQSPSGTVSGGPRLWKAAGAVLAPVLHRAGPISAAWSEQPGVWRALPGDAVGGRARPGQAKGCPMRLSTKPGFQPHSHPRQPSRGRTGPLCVCHCPGTLFSPCSPPPPARFTHTRINAGRKVNTQRHLGGGGGGGSKSSVIQSAEAASKPLWQRSEREDAIGN